MNRGIAVTLMLTVLALAGCGFKGDAAAANGRDPADYWRSRPTAIRVYPTTRFVRQGDNAVLEARVELFDEMGDSVKGSGDFRLQLHEGARPTADNLLYHWAVTLRTMEDHRRHYDPVTRVYLFRLKLDEMAVARRGVTLTVTYTPVDADRLTASAPVKTDW